MVRSTHWFCLLLLTFAAMLAAGCATSTPHDNDRLTAEQTPYPHTRSIATDGDMLMAIRPEHATPAHVLPWYAARNDQPRSVTVGYQTSRSETSYVRTDDYQRSSGGRIFDAHRQRTVNHSVIQITR